MTKAKDQGNTSFVVPLLSFFKRFHTILFFLVVSGSLFMAIVSLLSVIEISSSTASSSDQAINGTFDEDTISKIKNGGAVTVTPGKRTSPFTE